MVRKLHGAGIEVILDVVYNHTVEGMWWCDGSSKGGLGGKRDVFASHTQPAMATKQLTTTNSGCRALCSPLCSSCRQRPRPLYAVLAGDRC